MRRSKSPGQDRRSLLAGLGGIGLLTLTGCSAEPGKAATDDSADRALAGALAALEKTSGGKLGFAVIDCLDGTLIGHRASERFTMCSTFKLSLAAAILARMDAGEIAADAALPITRKDPVGHSPVVIAALDKGETRMTILALAEAAQTQSDNGAANILLRHIGGPAALTAFWRALGDDVSRLDRYEPELNTSHDGDPRDTTTPAAMANTLRAMLFRPALLASSRNMLIGWMVATQTGLKRLRGGLPADWRAGDKTGTMNGATYADKTNDLAIVWRQGRDAPFILTGFFEGKADGAEAVLAQAARIATPWMTGRPTSD
ncbi:MAG: class A beta-lactamase [Sphingobium sp.]|nr:class A beta-lactamase [Sphingobium sp.]